MFVVERRRLCVWCPNIAGCNLVGVCLTVCLAVCLIGVCLTVCLADCLSVIGVCVAGLRVCWRYWKL